MENKYLLTYIVSDYSESPLTCRWFSSQEEMEQFIKDEFITVMEKYHIEKASVIK